MITVTILREADEGKTFSASFRYVLQAHLNDGFMIEAAMIDTNNKIVLILEKEVE